MNLLFDLAATQPNTSGKRHGGGKYGEIVLRRILEFGYKPICFYDSGRWFNPEISALLDNNGVELVDIRKWQLDELVSNKSIDVLYSCLPTREIILYKGCKVKGTLHGLRGVETPLDIFQWKYKNVQIKNRVKFILEKILSFWGCKWNRSHSIYTLYGANPMFSFAVVSKHTANALVSYFHHYKDVNIPVFYSPSTSTYNVITERKYNDRYFLLVSGNRWEKNNIRAIMALDNLFSMGLLNDLQVRVTGCEDFSLLRINIRNPQRFVMMGYVEESELDQLYHDAFCFIYPSLNEGFGYPPLEAMRYGVPVLASPFSSIPEVCQGAAIYFNPFSVEEIMNRILLISQDKECYLDMSNRSRLQYEIITKKQTKDLDRLVKWIYES